MSTQAEPVDIARLESSIALVRSDAGDIYRKSWVLVGHVDNNPLSIDVVASSDTVGGEEGATLEGLCGALRADQVMYGLLRLTTAFDLSTTIKFIYIHWVGDKVPFAKKGRYGVVSGSVEAHFRPHHLLVETSSVDDLTEAVLLQKLEESSGTRSKVLEGGREEGQQERGFTAGCAVKRPPRTELRSVAPAGLAVPVSPELSDAIADVRNDANDTNWVVAGFEGLDVRGQLVVIATGCGNFDELKAHLDDEQVMYALYRTTDKYDDIATVKFVYLYWIGERVKPMTKGKVSALSGPIQQIFSPAHVTMSFSQRNDIHESTIKDKVMASSGSKLFVK